MCLEMSPLVETIKKDRYIAWSLHYFGVNFFRETKKSLQRICRENGIELEKVLKVAGFFRNEHGLQLEQLQRYPIDLIVEYLKHSHYLFVKRRIPFIHDLIKLIPQNPANKLILDDLKFIFPLFEHDFVEHIHREEDDLFGYIELLLKAFRKEIPVNTIYHRISQSELQEHALSHQDEMDEMEGIRELTNHYKPAGNTDESILFLFDELKAFDEQLQVHARIEDHLLFPKAVHLEKHVRFLIFNSTRFN